MSYNHLPVCVKPCFLYMGVFEEDRSIRVSTLMNLWVCEGFVKPRNNKTLETIAEEYFKELVDRNLILVDKLGSLGSIKYCKIHDLLRDVCLREARKQRLYCDVRDEGDSARGMISHRRVALRHTDNICRVLELDLRIRSIISDKYQPPYPFPDYRRTLRILTTIHDDPWGSLYILEEVFLHLNLRYLAFKMGDIQSNNIPSSIDLLWNLHTLIIRSPCKLTAPIEIWKMHQLRHIEAIDRPMRLPVPPPTTTENDIVIMENLHTLKGAHNLYLNEEVVKRIPNIKKLGLSYGGKDIDNERLDCLSYLHCLDKLESLICWTQAERSNVFLHCIVFPKSLKKLRLLFRQSKGWRIDPTSFELESVLQKLSYLLLLQKLVLVGGFFGTCKWETIEGQFPSLKVLGLHRCGELNEWVVSDSSHFPRLQELYLTEIDTKEIPSEIGNIETLKSIVLWDCCASLAVSAKEIVEEQEDLQGEQPDLHVRVICRKGEKDHLQHLASPNFHIDLSY